MRTKGHVKAIYPLTPMQEGMLYHALRDESSAYFEQYSYRLYGKLDVTVVEKTLNKLMERYDVLRTAFVYEGVEQPAQVVLKKRKADFYYEDLSKKISGNSDEKEKYIVEFKKNDRKRSFDLMKDALIRTAVLQLDEEEYEFVWSSHHIIMDGWCTEILMSDYFVIYNSLLANKTYRLPEVKQFRTYIRWLEEQDKEKSKHYWKKYVDSYDESVSIPAMNPLKSKGNEYRTENLAIPLEPEKVTALESLAARNQVTLNTVFQTAWGIILGKYNGKQDVVYAGVVSGRPSEIAGVESMIGMFVNTIPVRIRYEDNTPFKKLAREVQQDALNSEPHHYYPLGEIQSQSSLKQDLINHIFVFENYPFAEKIDGLVKKDSEDDGTGKTALRVEKVEVFEQTNYDFNFIVIPGRQFFLRSIYNAEVYERNNVERIINHLKLLIDQVTANEEIPIEKITLLSQEEKKQILSEFNNNKAEYPAGKTLHKWFQEQAVKTPGETAAVYENSITRSSTALTYAELNEKSNQLARLLREQGVKRDSIVGLLLNRSIDLIVGILGILKAGGAYLPIDTEYPKNRVLAMLQDSEVSYLLTQDEVIKSYPFAALENLEADRVKYVVTPPRAQITDFDSLPHPDRTLTNYREIHKYIGCTMLKYTVTLQASRGCPFRCAYCHKIWPKSFISRSAENILDEMKRCYEAGARRFTFIDDVFNFNKKFSHKLLNKIIDSGLDVQLFFPNGLRGDILDKETIDLMVKAGTVNIALALETISPRLQKLIKKNLHLERFKENVRYIIEKYPDVLLEMELMFGFPTETEEEALQTLEFLKSLKWVHFPNLHVLKIYNNTDMYQIALDNGVSKESIESSTHLAFHEIPDTTPFSKGFVREYQSKFMNEYFLSKERLLFVLPRQMKLLNEDELVQKYDMYLPMDIRSFSDILKYAGISEGELGDVQLIREDVMAAPGFCEKLANLKPVRKKTGNEMKILLLDLSQLFTSESKELLNDSVEAPLGLLYLLSYLNERFAERIDGLIKKSRIDFESYEDFKTILKEFKPDLIGIRTLSFYREFFHRTVSLIRQWGFNVPIITGGPYASSDYSIVLQDKNVDLVVLGEGEHTFGELVEKMLENDRKLPAEEVLQNIRGLAYVKDKDKPLLKKSFRDVIPMDRIREELSGYSPANLDHINREHDLVYVIYTSGSTGKPKGAMLEHRNMVNLLQYQYRDTNIDNSKILQFASIGFDASSHEIFSALLSGGTIYLINSEARTDIPELFRIVGKYDIKTVFLPISFLKIIFSDEQYIEHIPSCLSHIQTAGEQVVVSPRFKSFLQENKIYLHNHYGPAETHVVTTLTLDPQGEIPELPPIGKPILNTDIYILDKNNRLESIGVPGELYIGGMQVGRGYLRRDNLTAERFIDDPFNPGKGRKMYRTGDLSRWLPDGNIDFLGRIDLQVKIRGFRVEPGEIETHLLKKEDVKEAVVTIRTADRDSEAGAVGDKHLCAYIVPETELQVSEIRQELSLELPDYMVPAYFVEMEKIPLTPHGKVDYKALPDPVEMMGKGKDYEAPGNEMEEKIIKIWADVLGIDKRKIGIRDNFFELGGNSLNILRTLSRLNKIVEHKVSLSSLFLHRTVKELADNIYEEEKLAKLECIVKLNKGGNERNIFMIHPLNGIIYQYKELAKLLEEDFNVYGVQFRGLVRNTPFTETLDKMAADYVHQMRVVQPQGPYLVAAHCFGGMIAYDIVLLLEAMDCEVEKLILFNHPAFISKEVYEYYERKERNKNLLKPINNLLSFFGKKGHKEQRILEYDNMVREIQTIEQEQKNNPELTPDEAEEKKEKVEAYLRVTMNKYYKTKPVERHRGIIKADLFDVKADLTTQPFFEEKYLFYMTFGKVTLVESPGNNDTMFEKPQVYVLADQLRTLNKKTQEEEK